MTIWLIILAVIVLAAILFLASSIRFSCRVRRTGKDDRVELKVKALYGLVRLHYKMPVVVFEDLERGIRVELEKSGGTASPGGAGEQKSEGWINREAIREWLANVQKALRATKGFNRWFNRMLQHVRISKLDWSTDFSLGDAAYTGAASGVVWALKWTVVGWLSQHLSFQKQPRVFVVPVFRDQLSFATDVSLTGSLSLAYMLYAGAGLIVRIVKVEGGLQSWLELLRNRPKGRGTARTEE